MEVIAAICAKISEYVIEATIHQLDYLVCYNNNVNALKERLQNLVSLRTRVQHSIDEAKCRAEDVEDDVENWLTKVDQITEETDVLLTKIEEETKKSCSIGSCFLVQRHQLGRKTKKLAIRLVMIQEQGKFEKVSFQPPLTMIENIPGYLTFESRKSIVEGIMEALKDPNINMIGVHGMGGTGKTILVKEISCQVEKSRLFQPVIMVIIGQNPEVKSIQRQLAEMLKLPLDQETEQVRAAVLRKRIGMEKKILIILDDIWNGLDLERVGIPASRDDRNGCKILVTSRFAQVLVNEMSIEENFKVGNLTEEESWEFFKNKVNENSIETNLEMKQVAIEIVDKCGKLPIALATLAKALRKKPFPCWKDALRQLKHPEKVDIEGVSLEVYTSLKLSYDYINSPEAKLLFLLCSMFPDDYKINKGDLSRYALGMILLPGIETLEAARDRTLTLVVDLESSHLLQNSNTWSNECVTMHDVVRDVAIYIASTHDQIRTLCYGKGLNNWQDQKTRGNYTALLVDCKDFKDLPEKLSFPKLELLALLMGYRENTHLRISECFFEGMEILKVLHLRRMYFSLTPSSLDYLGSLRTLLLIDCQLGNTDKIGELKNLEVLDFSGSSIIELPKSISQLSRLKQLSVRGCSELEVIPPEVISRLTKLEDLNLGSFSRWEVGGLKNLEKKNASVSELDHLPCLTRLELCIPDVKYLPKKAFSKNLELEHFRIVIGGNWGDLSGWSFKKERILSIRMDSSNVVLEEGVHMLMKKCEKLRISATSGMKDVVLELNRIGCSHLKHLRLDGDSEDVEYLMSDFDPKLSCKPFTNLESLYLTNMRKLETIIRGSIKTVEVFENLKRILVSGCCKMKYVFPYCVIKALSNLGVIWVFDCEMVEAIVVMEDEEVLQKVDKIEFPQLRRLLLRNVPGLKSICCKPNTKGSIRRQRSEIVEEEEEDEYEDFHCQVSFPNLENLRIFQVKNAWNDQRLPNYNFIKLEGIYLSGCENFKSVFNCNTIKMFGELLDLSIRNCNAVEQVFEMNPNEGDIVGFSFKLEELYLENLPNLNQVWNLNGVEISFPSLTSFEVRSCPKIKKLFPTSLTQNLHQLTTITIHDCGNINEIFVNEELKTEYSKVSFSSLKELNISNVDGLEMIWHDGLIVDDMSKLERVELDSCKILKSVFKSNVMRGIKKLNYLCIKNCNLLEEVFEVHQKLPEEKHETVAINLERLEICDLPNLKQVWSHDPDGIYDFSNLKNVVVKNCPKLKHLFPPSIAIHLPKQLNHLEVDDDGVDAIFMKKEDFIFEKDTFIRCKTLKLESKKVIGDSCDHLKFLRELFPTLEVLELNGLGCYEMFLEVFSIDRIHMNEENQSRTYFASLKELYLRKLPKLLHIWKETSLMIEQLFDNLEVVDVRDCGRLNVLVPSSSFSFQNLKKLSIHRCHGLRSLFDGLVAKTLVHLEKMELSECKRMNTVVVERKDEAEVDEIVFSELKTLKLNDLPELSSFQSTKYTLKFPMLKRLSIKKCPEMKMFSRGIICTPFLTRVSVGDDKLEYFWEGNISESIQKIWEDDGYGYSIGNLFNGEDLEQN